MFCSECGAVMLPATDAMYNTADQRGRYTQFVWTCFDCFIQVEGEKHYTHPNPIKGERGTVEMYPNAE